MGPKKQSETSLLFERILIGFGEEYHKNLKELSIHPEHKDAVSRLLTGYPGLFDALVKSKTKYLKGSESGVTPEIDWPLFEKLTDHLDAAKRIVVKLLAENRSIVRPFWHVLKENCTYMSMVVDEIRKSTAHDLQAELPTLEDAPPAEKPAGLSLPELLKTEKCDAYDLRRYEADLETFKSYLARIAPGNGKVATGNPGAKYQNILKKGYVTVEEFRRFAESFALLTQALREALNGGKLTAMPEIFLDQNTSHAGAKGEMILVGPLLRNSEQYLGILRAIHRDVPCEEATRVFFQPGCQYLKEVHLALGYLVARELVERDLFSDEISRARRDCVDLLKNLGGLISKAEIETL